MRISLSPFPYYLVVTTDKAPLKFAFEPTLFNLPEHVALQAEVNIYSFYLVKGVEDKPSGVWHIYLNNEESYSPYRAPYGSVEFAPEVILEVMEIFIKAVLDFLLTKNVKKLSVISWASCYFPEQSALISNALFHQNFKVELSQVNHHIPVTNLNFQNLLHNSEKRRLKKCQRNHFRFQQESRAFLPIAYNFIKTCRIQKGMYISMSEEQIYELFQRFPDRYFIFSVKDGETIAALTIIVKVSNDILLTVFPASPYEYNSFSPSVLLNAGIYNYCKQNNYKIFDLGTSSIKENPIYSLITFKERIGGIPSLKLSFVWEKGALIKD